MRQTSFPFPIAYKLALGFAAAILLPSVILTTIYLTARQDIDRSNIESYVTQVGQRQRKVLEDTFARARESLSEFSADSDSNAVMLGLLLREIEAFPTLPVSREEEVAELMRTELLNPNTTLFRSVKLLDAQGFIVAAAGGEAVIDVSPDESNSVAYQRITSERNRDPSVEQVTVVTQRGQPTIELVNIVRLRSTDNVVGYLVASIDIDIAIVPTMQFVETTFPAYTFLQNEDNVIISLEETEDLARLSSSSVGVQRAINGEVGFSVYQIAGGAGEEVGGYYAPILGSPFVLVTQVAVQDVLRQGGDYFGVPGFVLVVSSLLFLIIGFVIVYNANFTRPISNLQRAMQAVGVGNFDEPVPDLNRADEFGELARTFVDMRQQTQLLVQELQSRISNRTRDFQTTQEISRVAVNQRDLQRLMDNVVDLIVERFVNIYHAQIFLLDDDRRFAVLRASTGSVGKQLLSRGHRLGVGSISVIGQVTAQGEVIIARDTAMSEVHRRNEFLPDTRAELAIPLRVGKTIIGALDVQSKESATFDKDQVSVLQTMADQVAIAIENARLYEESVRRIRSVQERTRLETVRSWRDFMFDSRTHSIVQQAGLQTDVGFDALREEAAKTGKPALGAQTERDTIPVAVPLKLRGEIIGIVACELPIKEYDNNKLQLAEDLVERLAISLDNTRLFEQSQRATERERLVNEISTKLNTQTEISDILQTAVREVGQALRAPQVSIRLGQELTRKSLKDE